MPPTQHAETSRETHVPPGFLAWVASLVHDHRGRLLAYARRRGLEPEEALDAVQETFVSFLRLPEARGIADAPEDSLKLLTVVLRHHVLNRRRKRRRHERAELRLELESPAADPTTSEELVASAEEVGRVHGCILKMALLQRRVVMLSLVDEQPGNEVARTLGLSEGHVRVLLHRARKHLRTCTFDVQ